MSQALDIAHAHDKSPTTQRFVELARLYLELTNKQHVYPRTPADIRTIYDQVVAGEIDDRNRPDGHLFRAVP